MDYIVSAVGRQSQLRKCACVSGVGICKKLVREMILMSLRGDRMELKTRMRPETTEEIHDHLSVG